MTDQDLLKFLEHNPESWQKLLRDNMHYYAFKLPKANGKKRLIEAPNDILKKVQKGLAYLLYKHYDDDIPSCVHGFIKREGNDSRSVISNAIAHWGKGYLLNIDLKDFYFQIDNSAVSRIVGETFPSLSEELHLQIVKVLVKDGRLPMGSPTSSVLSNMAFKLCDIALIDYCLMHNITYTRYVDDLSFSGSKPLSIHHQGNFIDILKSKGFSENPDKIKAYEKSETKEITGICLHNNGLCVSQDLKERISKNIVEFAKLRQLKNYLTFIGTVPTTEESAKKYKTLKKAIIGQIEFIKQVEGSDSETLKNMEKAYQKANAKQIKFDMNVYV